MKPRIVPFWFPNFGCTSRCLYCDQHLTQGEAIEMPSPEQIASTLLAAVRDDDERVVEAAYFGGTFTALPWAVQEAMLAPAAALHSQGLVAAIRISTHPSYVDGDGLERLRSLGVSTVELGIQSFSTPVLELSGRSYDEDEARAACRAVMEAGMALVVQLMPQLPSALAADDLHSARTVVELQPDAVRLFPTVVLASTGLADWHRAGRYVPPSLEQTAQRVGEMLEIIGPADIPVLRIGLQASRRLDQAVVAGPYHPALGELCYAALLARVAGRGLDRLRARGIPRPRLWVASHLASLLTGHDRSGLRRLQADQGERPFDWELGEPSQPVTDTVWKSRRFTVGLAGDSVAIS